MLPGTGADVVGGLEWLCAGQQQDHRCVPQDRVGPLDHQAGLVGDHPIQHPVATKLQYRQRECFDIVIRLRSGLFQLGRDVGETPVNGGAADPGPARDVVDGNAAKAVLFELDDGGVENGSSEVGSRPGIAL